MDRKNKQSDTDDYQLLEAKLFVEKGTLFQQRACCSRTHVNARECKDFLTAIVAAINRGDVFTEDEAVEVFFALTKLFTSKDVRPPRLTRSSSSAASSTSSSTT